MSDEGSLRAAGIGYAVAAYTFWGFAPVYFALVKFAAPLEVLAHRILWSLPLLGVLITVGRQWPAIRGLSRGRLATLCLCSALLSINWLTFIYAIQIEKMAETALGYYINPLVSIFLGWTILGEQMRPAQWAAAALALLAVALELFSLGSLPWLALVLACSFALYGLFRKRLAFPSSAGLGVETALLAPVAVLYLVLTPPSAAERPAAEIALLAAGGLVTVTPLIWFASAAARLPLTVLGLFQYLAPSITLLLAVIVYGETVPATRWYAFALIWLALILFSLEGLWHRRRAWRAAGSRPV